VVNPSVELLWDSLILPVGGSDSLVGSGFISYRTGPLKKELRAVAKWVLEAIEITGGFLPGLSLRLPPGLTCIIGPRGSGKSTLIEALRYGMGGLSGASKGRADLIQANLGSAIVTIRTAPDNQGVAYLIRRSHRQPPTLSTTDDKPIAEIDLDRGTFLPLDGYSSAEIEAIADESLGEKRRALLDELRGEELRAILLGLADQRRRLEANADAIRGTERLVADLTEQSEELGDARARLASLPLLTNDRAPDELVRASEQRQANAQESKGIANVFQLLSQYRTELQRELEVKQSANADLIRDGATSVNAIMTAIDDHLVSLTSEIERAEKTLRQIESELRDAHASQKATYDRLQEQNLAASEAIREHTAAEQAVANLNALETRKSEAKIELQNLLKARAVLKADYLLEREKISHLREDLAAALQHEAGAKVRIRVLRNADNLNYQQLLTEGLRGARVRNHEDILVNLMRLRPEQLAQIIAENDLKEFEEQLSLGQERCRRILDAFRENIDPRLLEVVDIEDRICIELNVSPGVEPNFKDAADLSRGQKCTALLPLLLARHDTPLVIDQPEDNLDNHFIYETVVETIRRLKQRRQLIFVTHNANIPVLAEVDLVLVMDSDGKRGVVQKAGSLDECREEIIDLLEGGKEAFELRRQRYGRP
jgi:energy-coupling factor transporter ATP-binding protein EcfA2